MRVMIAAMLREKDLMTSPRVLGEIGFRSLQGEHLEANIFTEVFSVTKLDKFFKKTLLKPPLQITEVLVDGPYN